MLNYELPVVQAKIADLKSLKNERDELDTLISALEDEIKTAMGEDQ